MSIQLPAAAEPLFKPKRNKVYFGGRGGVKSWSIAQALIIKATQQRTRVICARELQNSIKDSVLSLLTDIIDRLGYEDFFTITQNNITGANGSTFSFKGLKNNINSMKSFEGADICWIEEAESVTDLSWDVLIPTIRKAGSEIWVSFNPYDEMDPTYTKFVTPFIDAIAEQGYYEDERHYVVKTSWRDNPWLSKELNDERLALKASNYNKYLHVWEGEPSKDYEDAVIQPEWIEAAIDAHKKLDWEPRGIKVTGFDPADTGQDYKAYASRYGSLVTDINQWNTGDLEEGTAKVYDAALINGSRFLIYDSIGIGAGAKIKFRQYKTGMSTVGFCGSAKVHSPYFKYKGDKYNRDVFRNLRAQYYWYLRDRFEATYRAVVKGDDYNEEDLISLSSDLPYLKQLRSELSRIRRKNSHSTNGLIQIESKSDMAKRGMKSPNLADALMYTFADVSGGNTVTQTSF